MLFEFPAIGVIHSCFTEKFGIPRQSGLASLATAELEMLPPYDDLDALVGLEKCSHLWLQFVFHANRRQQWKPKVKPPRLGGNKSLGVFATRSPIRPAPIGLSVVKYDGLIQRQGKLLLQLSGVDLLDGTPVLDIKPYVPYADRVDDAINTIADAPPVIIPVTFQDTALAFCQAYPGQPDLALLIKQLLQQDPRPAYQQPDPQRIYGMTLFDVNIQWRYLLLPVLAIDVVNIRFL